MRHRWAQLVAVGAIVSGAAVSSLVAPTVASAAVALCSTPSLIAGIKAANITPGGGTVSLASGCAYTITTANNATDGPTGLPAITGAVTLIGNGASIARSSATGTSAFRLFDVAPSGSLTLSSLTLANGLANNGVQGGGAIFSHGTLTVSGSAFLSNSSPSTRGTSGGAIDSSGVLTVSTSTFLKNTAQEGGGIFNQKTATIASSTFTNNTALIYGGGALLNAAGTMTVTGSTFVNNSGPGGGAIDNDATLSIDDSTFNGNTAGNNGGGAIVNFGTTSVDQSTFYGNSATYGSTVLNYTGFSLSFAMSVIANGLGGGNCGGEAAITDGGYNIDTGSSCGFSGSLHSLSNTQPLLDALADNGGPTQTMAIPETSPAVDAIPSTVAGCAGSTDQRGIARPQGAGCDIGAYEVIVTTGDTQPPSTPSGLTLVSVTANTASLKWNASTDNVGVTGYTLYRNGSAVGSTGGAAATSYTDVTDSPATTYQYTVAAFDGSGNISPQSVPVAVTTPAPSGINAVQSGAVSTPTRVASTTINLSLPVHAGDLLVGWFGQYDAAGQVSVSDSVNGAWTRTNVSTTFNSGSGDVALFYVQNSAAAANGLTVTITAPSPTYLEGAVGEYSGIATSGAFDTAASARGSGTAVDSGPTNAIGAGELVVGGILTGGSPGTITPGVSQGRRFVLRTKTSSGSADLEDVLASSAGVQDAQATFSVATDWYAAVGAFHPYGAGDTQPPTIPTALAATSVTAASVTLNWQPSSDNVGVAGYTVYRNGAQIGTTAGTVTTFTDTTVSPSSSYTYTVDAFDRSGNHSPQSSGLAAVTPAASPGANWVQGSAVATGARVSSLAIQLTGPVGAGDLLVGWFGQYDAPGQVSVSDNVNGAWTRSSASTTFSNGGGDIALYYLQDSAGAPNGVTVTITATSPTYLQGSVGEYKGVALTNSLDQTAVAHGTSAAANSDLTAPVPAGELLFSGFMTGSSPGGLTANSGLTIRDSTPTGSVADADMTVQAAGAQSASFQLQTAADWYVVAAVFKIASGP